MQDFPSFLCILFNISSISRYAPCLATTASRYLSNSSNYILKTFGNGNQAHPMQFQGVTASTRLPW